MERLGQSFKEFANRLISEAKPLLLNKVIKTDKIIYETWKFDTFNYLDDGIISTTATAKYHIEDNWQRATHVVLNKIINENEYLLCEEVIKSIFPDPFKRKQQLQNFAVKVLDIYFKSGSSTTFTDIENLVNKFIQEFEGAKIKFILSIHIKGIAVGLEPVSIHDNVIVRRPLKEEFEKPKVAIGNIEPLILPSAIIEITSHHDFLNIPSIDVNKYCTLLKLYKLGSIDYISYQQTSSSSILLNLGRSFAPSKIYAKQKQVYSIDKSEEIKLTIFCNYFQEKIVELNSSSVKPSFIKIAFDRYNEALLENIIFERKIASIVMGLEALFSNKDIEISYSLSLLVAKFLGYLDLNSAAIRSEVKLAYDIRSKFAHGELYNGNKLESLKRKYGSEQGFLNSILNYLRISIVIILGGEFKKSELISLLDKSLIDTTSEELIKNQILSVKHFVDNI